MRAGRPAAALLVALMGCLGAVAYAATPDHAVHRGPHAGGSPAGPLPRPRLRRHPRRVEPSAKATFAFRAAGHARFQCRLDHRAWRGCRSPVRFAGLSAGRHRFAVRVAGRRRRHGPAARYRWRVLELRDFSIVPRLGGLDRLFPGAAPQPLPLTIANPNPVPILVTGVSVTTTAGPPGCPSAENLALTPAGVSPAAPLRVPPHGSVDLPTAAAAAPSIQLRDLPVDQDACQRATFPLAFSGSARG
jgi:hypothetical protein